MSEICNYLIDKLIQDMQLPFEITSFNVEWIMEVFRHNFSPAYFFAICIHCNNVDRLRISKFISIRKMLIGMKNEFITIHHCEVNT